MTTVEALKIFYVSRGGNFSDVENISTIPEMIIAINNLVDPEQDAPLTSNEIETIINSIN